MESQFQLHSHVRLFLLLRIDLELKFMKTLIQFLILLFFTACNLQNNSIDKPLWIISAPSGNGLTKIDKNGKTVIPNGRYITPAGKSIITAPHPYGLTLSPDGNIAVTANSGTSPLSITIVRDILSQHPEVQQVPPGPSTDAGVLSSVFMGLAISPDNLFLF